MTNLPQTTPVRPSQGPNSPLAAGHSAAGNNMAFQMTGADVWRVVRTNLWLIIAFVIVFGIGGYFLNAWWVRTYPRFTANGWLELQKRQVLDYVTDKAVEMADTQVMIELRTEAQKLQTEALFSEVLKKQGGKIRDTEWFKQFLGPDRVTPNISNAKEYLQDYFRATPVPDSNLLSVSVTWTVPRDCKVIVEEIVNEYLAQQSTRARSRSTTATSVLQAQREDLQNRIQAVHQRVQNQQDTLAKAGMSMAGSEFSVKHIELKGLIEAQLKLQSAFSEAQNTYKRVKDQLDQAGGTLSEVERAIENDMTLANMAREQMSLEIQRDSKAAMLGKEHRDVINLNSMVELMKKQADDRRTELRAKYRETYVRGLENAAAQAEADLKNVTRNVEQLKRELADLTAVAQGLMNEQQEERSLRDHLWQIVDKEIVMQATNDTQAQARVSWVAFPEIPEIPSFPKLKLILPAAILLGLALALGIAFLREFLNDTVRSPRDISRVGQLTLLGIIADEADDPQVADAKLAIFDAPRSLTAEQFRQVRTRMQYATSMETTRTIMVSGPSPTDGATTVAANLAAGLALNGKRVLLVDANFRRPELHRLFGFANERGFSDVLGGTAQPADLIHTSRVPNLSVLCSGPQPANATELFESQLLTDFIDRRLEEFDHIVFDSAPFLVVSEAPAMAARVDGVVTVVRAHAESRGVLLRMRDMLRQLKAQNIGVVLNAVRAQGGGYYRRNIKTFYTYNNEA